MPKLAPMHALLLSMFSLQGGAVFAKSMFPQFGAVGTCSLRVGIAFLLMLIVFRPAIHKLNKQQWYSVLPYGITLGLMNMFIYCASERMPLGLAVSFEFVGPLLLALLMSRKKIDLLWVILAGVGIFLITPRGITGQLSVSGVAFALAAGAMWAGYILSGGLLSRHVEGILGVSAGMLVANIVVLPFGIISSHNILSPNALICGSAVAILSSIVPYPLEMRALKDMPATTFGILMSLEPAIAAICALVFLGERLGALQWLAILCIVLASAGVTAKRRKA